MCSEMVGGEFKYRLFSSTGSPAAGLKIKLKDERTFWTSNQVFASFSDSTIGRSRCVYRVSALKMAQKGS